jgi:tRNA A-37 threonylcarbamoyl transferase component Bud32
MQVDALRLSRFRTRSSRVELRPDSRDWLASCGLSSASDFLQLPGIVVSGHVGRNVSRVEIGGRTAYLKREHRVRWRDRFRSWHMGFGWSSVSAREARVLRRLEECRLPGPKWLACGESAGQAFLLVAAAENAVDLQNIQGMTDNVASRIGREIARIHAAGIDQPDLFAKHILVNRDSGQLTILDWQRARLRPRISLHQRIRTLASLRATAADDAFGLNAWQRLLVAYRDAAGDSGFDVPEVQVFADRIDGLRKSLAHRPGIRSQARPAIAQELVRIDGETVCAIPSVAAELKNSEVIAALYDPKNDECPFPLSGGRVGILQVGRYARTLARSWAAIRGKNWRAPEVQAARLLFHLERFGVSAPKLLAYGQIVPRLRRASSFLLFEATKATRPLLPGDRVAAQQLMTRLHEIGCHLVGAINADCPFEMDGDEAVVSDVAGLRLVRRVTPEQARRDLARVDAFFAGAK